MNSTGNYLSLVDAAKACPGRPNASTIWRWARKGVKARNGARIRLDHVRVGGRVYVVAGAMDTFFKALADADVEHFERGPEAPEPKGKTRTTAQREAAVKAAAARLAAHGLTT